MQPSPLPSPASLRRQRVHDAVRELMAEQGFRVSMDAVAARAGCSKQTLYSHFGSKQELLRSVMQEHLDMATARLDGKAGGATNPRTTLLGFAMEHLQRLSDPSVVATCQLLSAEASQFPEEARTLYRDGCETLQRRLAEWLRLAMRSGQLRHDDPHYTAELLLGMIVGLDFERQRFAVPHRDSDDRRKHWAGFAVDAFLRAFSVDASPAPTQPHPIFPISRP
ncbi:TetR family transcriptional regulator [Pseudoxanthomonas yeongjuensis]|uniref:TetR/AcrR family transcriptional regulator n=1 Tax=Pseudoxanthomonas yeongjuensis TaxID=377616 RepID=UPI00139206E0|nr:TetR/AcrR family transcriptional regulator [Pseudoxanthomonas yeongjuensis]KAF1717801.1 TetR family transcriptional regulator [Pseudoxanthomonas yeongjuensis]